MRHTLTSQDRSPRVYVIHENDEWIVPLRKNFGGHGIPFAEWHLDQGILDLRAAPPPGVFYNRMSASSHTRNHRYAPELTGAVLAWLKGHDALVVNGERALQLELSKVAQYEALSKFGIETPQTLAVVGKASIADTREDKFQTVRHFDHPLIAGWQGFLAENGIAIAGIEFIVDENGRSFTYDVNTNTNYNPDAEAKDGRAGTSSSGMGAIASHLGKLLARETRAGVSPLAAAAPA